MNEITRDIWIGAIEDVSEQDTSCFDSVLSVCQDTRAENVGCRYRHVPLAEDEQAVDSWGGSCSYETFVQAADALYWAIQNRETVLVHCHNGQNRSVSVVIAVLVARSHRDVEYYRTVVQSSRPIANPSQRMLRYAERYAHSHR